ncbi:ABC transporter permease, partial [Streptomyces sp. SID8455]|nr:ABC transporter permease [Streptomyces sp. SID8455]
ISDTAAPGPALLALCLWAAATLTAAALALRHRDA